MVVRKRSSAATNSEYQDKDNMDKDNIDKNNIEKDNMDKDKYMHAFHNLLQTDTRQFWYVGKIINCFKTSIIKWTRLGTVVVNRTSQRIHWITSNRTTV